jgi:uncharacterized membrane protein YdjX (TVP38/TMEM64 family)
MRQQLKKYLPILLIISLSIFAWFFDLYRYFSFDTFKENQQSLELFIESNTALSIAAYCGIYILVVALSIPGATFMTLIGGFLLGQWIGSLAVVVSATLGATILFLSAKMASTDLLSKKAGPWTKKMQKGFQENALSYLLTLRLIPIFPFVAINIAAAFFQIPLRTFFFGTFFGIIPGSFVYISIGVALREVIQKPDFTVDVILDPKILLAFTGLGILSLLPVVYKKMKK